jgi:Flp pilus assembly protein TadG
MTAYGYLLAEPTDSGCKRQVTRMLKQLGRVLGDFIQERRGNVAILFAFSLIPLLLATGVAVDYGRAMMVRDRMADAADSAALAIGSWPGLTQAQMTTKAQQFFDANYPPSTLGTVGTVSVSFSGNDITAIVSGTVKTTFMGVANILGANIDHIDVGASSTITKQQGKIELALVLDNTGSMAGTKIANLKSAASNLVDQLAATAQGADADAVRLSLVPYTMTVNVGPTNKGAAWLTGVMPTAYVPYFAPDEPDTSYGGYVNNYLTDVSGDQNKSWQIQQGDPAKYNKAPKTGTTSLGYQFGPNSGCEIQPLTRLTNSFSGFKAAINSMTAGGDTDIKAGLMWGWHTLSPNPPFADGVTYGKDGYTKIMILMTDGQNHNVVLSDNDQSAYSDIGYIWQGRLGIISGSLSQRISVLDQKLAQACANAKTAGVVIYTVVIDDPTVDQSTIKNCASDSDKLFDVSDSSGLDAAFSNIAGSIQNLRIAK